MDWPEDKKFGTSPGEEVSRAKEAPPYNELPENEKKYALFTDGVCCIVGKHCRWNMLCGAPHDKLQRPLKVKENQVSSQR